MRMDEKTTNAKKNLFVSVKEFFQKDLVQYIVKRLFMFFPTLFLISILAFFVIQLPETDYVDREISKLIAEGEMITQEEADALRKEYGLDLPVHERYIKWVSGIIWTPTEILELRRGIQAASCVGPGKSNLPFEMNACLPGCVWNATPRSLTPLERNIGFWTPA